MRLPVRFVAPVTAFVVVTGVVLGALSAASAPASAPTPSATAAAVTAIPTPTPTSTPTIAPSATPAATPEIAPIALDITLTGTMPWSATLEPPNAGDDYTGVWQLLDEEHGFCDYEGCSTYLFAHSRTAGNGKWAEGNAWQHLSVGDLVTFDGVEYVVTRRVPAAIEPDLFLDKGDLATAPGLWEHAAGRLFLITCDERDVNRGNAVVFLERI